MKPKMQSDIRNIKGDRGRWLAALKSESLLSTPMGAVIMRPRQL